MPLCSQRPEPYTGPPPIVPTQQLQPTHLWPPELVLQYRGSRQQAAPHARPHILGHCSRRSPSMGLQGQHQWRAW